MHQAVHGLDTHLGHIVGVGTHSVCTHTRGLHAPGLYTHKLHTHSCTHGLYTLDLYASTLKYRRLMPRGPVHWSPTHIHTHQAVYTKCPESSVTVHTHLWFTHTAEWGVLARVRLPLASGPTCKGVAAMHVG